MNILRGATALSHYLREHCGIPQVEIWDQGHHILFGDAFLSRVRSSLTHYADGSWRWELTFGGNEVGPIVVQDAASLQHAIDETWKAIQIMNAEP